MLEFSTPIYYVKGIGPERANVIRDILNIQNVEDLLNFFPNRYVDKSVIYKINQLTSDITHEISIKGKIVDLKEIPYARGKRLVAKFKDETGTMDLVWFKYSKWMKNNIQTNTEVVIFGRIQKFGNVFSMPHPEIEKLEDNLKPSTLFPIYPSSEKLIKQGLGNRFFQNVIKNIVSEIPNFVEENLPNKLISRLKLISRAEAYQNIHFPKNMESKELADLRLKFEESFFFQLEKGLKKKRHKTTSVGNPFHVVGEYFSDFYKNHLPFDLTNAQKRVLKEIRRDMKLPIQMNRLLQGDVGSGKTIVALLSMLIALDNGFQSCIMTPTEILAQQHYNSISELLSKMNINVKLLTGSTKSKDRKIIYEDLIDGSISILVGTHALLEDKVKFKNLGLAIIDEQHRFGVAQRAKLWSKNNISPHILVMTATPIPRTLAMSFYSDLDVSIIEELPAGRKPIITKHRREKDRVFIYNFAKDQIANGRQVYFVYPLIEESETLDYKNLNEGFDTIRKFFPLPNYDIVMLHGRMKPEEKEFVMQYFSSGKAQIMVATTVIEVGVNVPNASIMIIESAERFGLSQLHQLRGRVGRGVQQSYCILMTSDKLTNESRKRISTMVETNDGFKISEVDLQLRGPGDIMGTKQSGVIDFKKLDLAKDFKIISKAMFHVEKILEMDPNLSLEEHRKMKEFYINYKSKKGNKWDKIS